MCQQCNVLIQTKLSFMLYATGKTAGHACNCCPPAFVLSSNLRDSNDRIADLFVNEFTAL